MSDKTAIEDDFVGTEQYNGVRDIDEGRESTKKNYDRPEEKDVPVLMRLAFIFISFGYMLPWTSLGSLISYYKYKYSANFYVKIYVAYYLPGLPVALLQYRYDEFLDGIYGSKNTYMTRGVVSFTSSALILFSLLWLEDENQLILLFLLLGISSWMCHGTATMMASMYPKEVIAYLQIGFRCPELYLLIAYATLSLNKDVTVSNLTIFYKSTAIIVLFGMICWILVTGSPTSMKYFADKDFQRRSEVSDGEGLPLIAKENYTGRPNNMNHSEVTISRANRRQDGGFEGAHYTNTPTGRVRYFFKNLVTSQDENEGDILPLCAALILTIWGSIFQAAFFAYVESPRGRNIEEWLYFTRLMMDLLGRPLTFLPRPSFLQVSNSVVVALHII